MVDTLSLNYLPEAGGWPDQIPRLEDGWWPTGGAVDPANDGGLMNWQAQLLAQRTRFLKSAIDAHVAIVGVSVADNGLIWSSDGSLMVNATGGDVAPTGTARSDLEANGFVEFVTHFASSLLAEATPAGAVAAFAFDTPPDGWLECDGSQINRGLYADLFAGIGTQFGVGDGATTFHLPDLRGEFLRGWDNGRGVDVGRGFGTAQIDAFGAHRHVITAKTWSGNGTVQWSNELSFRPDTNVAGINGTSTAIQTANTDTVGDVETRPRNVAMMFCIKY